MATDVKAIISQMTDEEKAALCGGADFWHTRAVERLGIPRIMVSDGPHGLRKQREEAKPLDMNDSIQAVCFPAGCALAASFDRALVRRLGEALGEECRAEKVAVLLGPAINIKRSPLCGRNFEYLSEDPYLAGELAAAYINGVQSRGVGTSLKHFAANNQEYFRLTLSAEIDERSLREIYLSAFETAVKKAQPWTVMCSYNRINGVHSAENKWLLNDVLRDEWGFQGLVMSDWFAVADRPLSLKAGLDLEMPYSGGHNDAELLTAVKSGRVTSEELDTAVERILSRIFAFADDHSQDGVVFDREKHHTLAGEIEKECAVLLKNEGILPFKKGAKLAFIGPYAKTPRYQGGGSSHIKAARVTGALEVLEKAGFSPVTYVEAFPGDRDDLSEAALKDAVAAAKDADGAVIFAGLPDYIESEGYDRPHMRLPDCQNRVIEAVAAEQKNTVVVLHNGSPVEMPWIDRVPGVLEMYLGGEAVGEAVVSILFGDTNPSGKLPESFPLKLEDSSGYPYFPGDGKKLEYREGVFVGYRFYDIRKQAVLFPFGHGLSYTAFEYKNLRLSREGLEEADTLEAPVLKVSVEVRNTGKVRGKEIVQLYVEDHTGAAPRPLRELKGFEKVDLGPGETRTVSFILDERAFDWYHPALGDWYAAPGEYTVAVGSSSRDIRLSVVMRLSMSVALPFQVDMDTTVQALLDDPRTREKARKDILDAFKGKDGITGGSSEGNALAAITAGDEWQRRGEVEMPLRHLYMIKGIPFPEVEKLVREFNELLGTAD